MGQHGVSERKASGPNYSASNRVAKNWMSRLRSQRFLLQRRIEPRKLVLILNRPRALIREPGRIRVELQLLGVVANYPYVGVIEA
jgi:hypothetical protein